MKPTNKESTEDNGHDNLSGSRNFSPNDRWVFKSVNEVNTNILATFKNPNNIFNEFFNNYVMILIFKKPIYIYNAKIPKLATVDEEELQ